MRHRPLGLIVSAAVTAMLAQTAAAADKAPAKASGKVAGSCVHNCAGYAECKGHGNNSCKGKNDCAGSGLVPKACSSQTNPADCKKVLDTKKNEKCTWLTK
jgi:hypothetical protein